MNSFEFNKIFAAVLVAGIVACFSGFLAKHIIHPEYVVAVAIEESEGAAGGGAAVEQLPEPVLALIAGADPEQGQRLFKACATCHSVVKGGPDGVGPNLWNVMARGAATHGGFAFSNAMLEHKGEPWSYEALNKFLWKPKTAVPGTKMNYVGLRKPEDRAAVIAYLRTIEDSAPALPSADRIAAEQAALAPPAPEEAAAPDTPAADATTAQ